MNDEAPERIWIEDEFGDGHEDQWQYGSWDARNEYGYVHPYIRADLANALVAAAYKDVAKETDCGGKCGGERPCWRIPCAHDLADEILALTPDDAKAALDAMLKAERAKALKEAEEICTNIIKNYDVMKADGKTYEPLRIQKAAKGMVSLARADIRALAQEDKE